MKAPSWMRVAILPGDGSSKGPVRARVTIKKWHPGFWLWFARQWIRNLRAARKRRKDLR